MENQKPILERIQNWSNTSISLKLFTISFLILMLMIPQSYTNDLIRERQNRQWEAEYEITEKWSREQKLTGPYLAIPFYTEREVVVDEKTKILRENKTAYLFPENLEINGVVEGEPLHRGIFDVVVYKSKLNINGNFTQLNYEKLGIDKDKINWSKVKLLISVEDLRGIGENPLIEINGKKYTSEPYNDEINFLSGLAVELNLEDSMDALNFKCTMSLKGSKELFFVPIGKTTEVNLQGTWKDPSFQGNFLPESREVNEDGFNGSWKILHFNRPFGQEFVSKLPALNNSSFGLALRMPVDQYQQSTRSSKYALLIIVLSFLSMFLMEVITKSKIHPLQYILVGLALVLYYTILIALSEHIGFNIAYFISSIATIALVALYALTFFKNKSNMIVFSATLTVFYAFVFVITKEQDYALLIGSVGLFIALAATMFASRKIEWYKH
jgi:inner membrane protein